MWIHLGFIAHNTSLPAHQLSLLWSHCSLQLHSASTVTLNHAHIARKINKTLTNKAKKKKRRNMPSSAQSAYVTNCKPKHIEIFDGRCPWCEAIYWYRGPPVFKDVDKCHCYVHFCNSCGKLLCSCTIDSLFGVCPRCGLRDNWVIIPPEIFSIVFTNCT